MQLSSLLTLEGQLDDEGSAKHLLPQSVVAWEPLPPKGPPLPPALFSAGKDGVAGSPTRHLGGSGRQRCQVREHVPYMPRDKG